VRGFIENSGVTNTPETLADTIQPLLRHGLVPAAAGGDLLILDANANQVMRLACANASLGDVTAVLDAHGLLATSSGHALGADIPATALSRRRMLQGAAAAGVIGVTVLTLPSAAMAASGGPGTSVVGGVPVGRISLDRQ